MNRSQLVAEVAERMGITPEEAMEAYRAFTGVMMERLQAGEKVALSGFGTFEVRDRAPRIGKNPRTKKEMDIPAMRHAGFRAGKTLREVLNP